MSNYVQTTIFTPKDTLPTTDPNKTIFGAAYDVEFGNISTAITSKYDINTVTIALTGMLNAGGINLTNTVVPANGWYLPSANTLGVATASTQRGTINAAGNWTINAPTSGTALVVNGVASGVIAQFVASNPTIRVQDTGAAGSILELKAVNLKAVINSNWTTTATSLSFQINSTEYLSINTSGNVVVPGPASGVALAVNGAASTAIATFNGANNSGSYIQIQNAAVNIGFLGDAAAVIASGTANNFGIVAAKAGSGIDFGVNGNVKTLSIASAGNVTIAAPTSGTTLVLNALAGGNHAATMTDGTVSVGFVPGSAQMQIGTDSNHPLSLYVNGVTRLNITTAGDIAARGVALCKFKASDSTSSSTTPAADPDLQIALPGSGTWEVEAYLQFGGDATAATHGLNAAFFYTGTINISSMYSWVGCLNASATAATRGTANSITANATTSNVVTTGNIVSGTTDFILMKGKLSASGAGTIGINFGQNATGTGVLTMFRTSYMKITQLS